MHTEERRDNGPRPEAMVETTPVHVKAKRPMKLLVLPFLAGLLVAGLLFGAFMAGGAHSRTQGSADLQGLSLVRSSDVNYLRFTPEEVREIAVTSRNGSVEVRLHSENFIGVHSSATANHEIMGGALSVDSRNGNFTILLPQIVLDNLAVDTRNGRVFIGGASGDNTVISRGLHVETRNGGVTLVDLAIPNGLEIETRNGSINISNVLSDESNTRLNTRNGRINTN